ncbi:hypothetical protein [Mycolicibacterium sphagni]|uniref:hypothetical protein n=1 Tax=Mycolicibacterium sphagni TaxID=1786 RepID=UPI0021F27562|nr:hypothetical protein [Mycolicibacterium sphagni]MCV7174839.1 hypothetical protein [Mycolicibacterium sphagni]
MTRTEKFYRARALDCLEDAQTGLHITGDDPRADNDARASYAAHATLAFGAIVSPGGGCRADELISDLLADLLHLCDALAEGEGGLDGVDFDYLMDRARRNYDAEIRGEL